MRTKANREEGALSNAPPPRADTGGPGAAVPGRWLGVNTRSEDRRKDDRGGYRVPGYRPSIVVRHEFRSGKERRRPFTIEDHRGDAEERSGEDRRSIPQPDSIRLLDPADPGYGIDGLDERRSGKERRDTLIAPDDECVCGEINARNCPVHGGDFPEGLFDGGYGDFGATADHDDDTAEQHDAEAERWHERHYPSGVSDRAVVRCDKPPSQCGEYGGTHQPGRPNAFCDCRCHDTIDSAEDIDYESVDFVHSILQAEIDRDLLTRAQYPSYRRDEHEHAGLGVPPVQGERWGLFHRWGRALRRRIPSSSFYVASPGLQWGSERGPTGGAR